MHSKERRKIKTTPDNARPSAQVKVNVRLHGQVSVEPALETLPQKGTTGETVFDYREINL